MATISFRKSFLLTIAAQKCDQKLPRGNSCRGSESRCGHHDEHRRRTTTPSKRGVSLPNAGRSATNAIRGSYAAYAMEPEKLRGAGLVFTRFQRTADVERRLDSVASARLVRLSGSCPALVSPLRRVAGPAGRSD